MRADVSKLHHDLDQIDFGWTDNSVTTNIAPSVMVPSSKASDDVENKADIADHGAEVGGTLVAEDDGQSQGHTNDIL